VNITRDGLYNVLGELRLKAHRSSYYGSVREKADELNRAGRSFQWIAQRFNQQHLPSASGKPWKPIMVKELLRRTRDKAKLLENIHRSAIADAIGRGLDFPEIAIEFNQKKLGRRRGSQPWTARSVRQRWTSLKQLQRSRELKGSATTELAVESVILKKSA